VLTDRQLRRLAGEKNHTIETIAAIVDPMFAERFGTELIELLSDAAR
jgi:hypothetical protein